MIAQTQLWTPFVKEELQPIDPIPPSGDLTLPDEWPGGVHPDGFLEVTKGFYLHVALLSRMLRFLAQERQSKGSVYEQIAAATGMSASQSEALVQCAAAMLLLTPRSLVPTPLCTLILSHDPFFDRTGTLWLLHYLLASNPQLVVWNYTCNAILPSVTEISREDAVRQFAAFAGRWSEESLRKKVTKELRALFAAYTEQIFAALHYLRVVGRNTFAVNRDVAPVPPLILLATTLIYRDRFHPGASGVEIPELVYAEHTPGRLLRQGESTVRRALDTLHESRYVGVEAKANLDQIRFRDEVTWLDALRLYYDEVAHA